MSIEITKITQCRRIGSPTQKALLIYMSGYASENGCEIWVSKARMSADLEMDIRTIRRSVKALLDVGIIAETGHKKCTSGFTVEYKININVVKKLPLTSGTESPHGGAQCQPYDTESPVAQCHGGAQDHGRGGTGPSHGGAQCPPNHPLTINEPSKEKNNKKENSRFGSFWNTCPRKVGKGAAKAAFSKACKNEDPQVLINAMAEYARSRIGEDQQYTVHPATWLNQERWGDEIPKATPIANQRGHHEQHCQNNTNSDAAIDQIARIAGVI